jgi:sugar phosphate isomerase/epimerase
MMTPNRLLSLAYLSAHRCSVPQALAVAHDAGYQALGLRLMPNAPGGPHQALLHNPALMREALAVQRDTGIQVLDLEIIRIGESFELHAWDALLDAGQALGAQAVLVAGDDPERSRLSTHYAELCEHLQGFGLTADLEFMPWTAVPDARSAIDVIQRASEPANAGILVDALHVGRSHTSLDDLRAIPRHWLHYAQICDGLAGTHFTTDELIFTAREARSLPGEGSIDVHGIFQALPADLPVSIEVIDRQREHQFTPLAWAQACLCASRPYL